MTALERIRQQFQEALEDLEARVFLERLEEDLASLSLKQLGEILMSPMGRCVASVPAASFLRDARGFVAER